ncbi:MAG: DUF2341 domain-containing protein [Candidatus Nitrosoabyssus spongiisocia]|nr:MAG: DUF2341 domain-containing protein [Nitrosopumilaceae archaeon AB1(1)]
MQHHYLTGSTDFNSNDLVSAQIGNGLNFDGVDNNTGDYLDLPDLEGSLFNNTDFTISAWANIDAFKSWARIVDFGNGHEQANIIFRAVQTISHLEYQIHNADNVQKVAAIDVLQIGQWAYLTVVHESSGAATIYKDGTSHDSRSLHTSNDVNRTSNYIGRANNPDHFYFDGKFDEFRLSSTARSADWIATEYANQNSPSTFFTISAPEDRRVVITSAITNTQGDNIIITFNENIIYSVIPTTDFTLTGTSATISGIISDSSSITLNLSRNLLSNEIITISYTKTSGGINSTQNTDITLESFVNQPVINNILDTIAPVITLNGASTITLSINSTYNEQNATTDDGSPIVIGGDTVDTNTVGNYTITYNSVDSSGNDAIQVNRTVVVQQTLDTSWNTRLQITIDSSQVIGNHENFTVLISINDTNLNSTTVQSAGQDIRFTTTDGTTLLEHEIESFTNNATTGTLVAWVRLPTLSSTSDTILYMYYNVSTASSIPYPDVWDSDYVIIYHMDQSTFGAQSTLDSSGNDCHATPLSTGSTDFNSSDLVSAQIGNGLNFDGVDNNHGDYLDLPDLASSLFYNTDFTISAWANIDVLKNWARIVDFGKGQANHNILFATPPGTTNLRYEMLRNDSSLGVTAE